MEIEGAILVGGESRRMGRDKSTLILGGRPVLERLKETLAPLTCRLRVVGGSGSGATAGLEHQPDLRPGLGPLSGIHSALSTAHRSNVLVVACDLPFVTTPFLTAIAKRASSDVEGVVPLTRDGPVPVCALYRTTCLRALEARLDRGELSAQSFVESIAVRWVRQRELRAIDPEDLCLFNMNDPSDYEAALAIVARETP
ncbi:MAG TPA: molybdenum cofactor guanylyltransferase [Vicinamibacteria bacterium]|nr:molybdenum cofactor guanylyltransferase [Vicinamibacteria bacterium]